MLSRRAVLSCLFILVTGCSSSAPDTNDEQPTASALTNGEPDLTLENVYLGHADPRDYEPGDAQYRFPVAAQIFYGYRPLQARIVLDAACAKFTVKETKAPSGQPRDTKYDVSCEANGKPSRVIAHSVTNYGQEEDSDSSLVLGTSLRFESGVKLVKLAPDSYQLQTAQ